MNEEPALMAQITTWLSGAGDQALQWLASPAAWSQFAMLAGAFLLATLITAQVNPVITRLVTPAEGRSGLFATARRNLLRLLPLLLPLLAYGLTAVGEEVTRSIFGTAEVIGFGKRVFLFLAARAFVRDILTDPFLRLLGRYVLLPAMAHCHLPSVDCCNYLFLLIKVFFRRWPA